MFATKDYSARGAGDILKHFQLGIVIRRPILCISGKGVIWLAEGSAARKRRKCATIARNAGSRLISR